MFRKTISAIFILKKKRKEEGREERREGKTSSETDKDNYPPKTL